MILVTVGSNGAPFDRLLRAINELGVDEDLLVQHGPSQIRPRNANCIRFLHFTELERAVRSARIVITHAGVGSVLLSLMNEKRPVVVPRLARFGEVVDDHQLHFAERLAREELVTFVPDPRDLRRAVEEGAVAGAASASATGTALQADLRDYLRHTLNGNC